MNNFVNSIKELHNNSIYIEKFIHFMEIENSIVSDKDGAGKSTLVKLLLRLYDPDNKVAEDGSHNELMKNNSIYAKMFEMQSGRYQ